MILEIYNELPGEAEEGELVYYDKALHIWAEGKWKRAVEFTSHLNQFERQRISML